MNFKAQEDGIGLQASSMGSGHDWVMMDEVKVASTSNGATWKGGGDPSDGNNVRNRT